MKVLILLCFLYTISSSQDLENVDSSELKKVVDSHKHKKIVLVSYWATWSKLCLKQLPIILEFQKKYKMSVEVIIVSMDSPKNRDRTLKFIESNKVNITTYFKTEADEFFHNLMPDEWSGELPYNIIYSKDGNTALLLEGQQTTEMLEQNLNKMTN